MTDHELFTLRIALVQAYLARAGHDGIILSRIDNFAMATGGRRNHVSSAAEVGAASLYVPRAGAPLVVCNNIETPRMRDEEIYLDWCDTHAHPWWDGSAAAEVQRLFNGTIVSDDGAVGANVNDELAELRALLTDAEMEKYRVLGRRAAEAMEAALAQLEAGMSERDAAVMLQAEAEGRGCFLPVCLIAADERIAKYRHPLPPAHRLTAANAPTPMRDYVMVVGGFVSEGLSASITRFKRFRELPGNIEQDFRRVCAVDAVFQEATQPGRTLGEVFRDGCKAYAGFGFAETEWHNHHQGGATGYAARTRKGAPGEPWPVLDMSLADSVRERFPGVTFGQAYAWNPSAPGVKSEDTFLLREDGTQEIITATPNLPAVDLEAVLGRATGVVKSDMAQ